MMFLIKTAFWLTVLILLLPTDEQQRSQIYGTAQAAVNDVTTFCDRNPATCDSGQEAFTVLVQKAQYGAALLMDLMSGEEGEASASLPSAPVVRSVKTEFVAPAAETDGSGPALWERADSQDTLSPDDRDVAWGMPESGQ
jgi:hypothetical protein